MHPILRKLFTNTESDTCRPLQKQVEASKSVQNSTSDNDNCDLTPDEYEQSGQLIPIDYGLSLRLAIQEHKQSEQKSPITEVDNISPLKELVNPELIDDYQKLIETLEAKTKVSKDHPEREFIDIEHETIAKEIEQWIGKLIKETEAKRGSNLAQDDIHELEALSWFHFDSLATILNTKSLELDITEFYKPSKDNKPKAKDELLNSLSKRYPLKKDELEILIDLMTSKKDSKSLLKTVIRIWKQYELGKRKGTIAKIVLCHLTSTSILNAIPFFFQYGVDYMTFTMLGGNTVGACFHLQAQTQEARLMNHVRSKINERIIQSLFFRRYEFTQSQSLGEIFMALEKGKESTINLLSESISQLVPEAAGIGTAFGCLTLINPILGVINLSSIPINYLIGKVYNNRIKPIHESENKEREEVANQLNDVKQGMQQILTSPNIPEIASSVKDRMDKKDELSLQRLIHEIKMRFAGYFTMKTTMLASAGSGYALYKLGRISEGAVYSNLFYSGALSEPFKDLIDMYFTRFARYVQDIQRMEEVLGEVDMLDLPDGEKESKRIPVSDLDNYHISVKGLNFKNIFENNINLEIGQGEFVTIAGSSGVGKSTLLKNIVGLYQPDNGSVQIGGIDVDNVKKYGNDSIYSILSYCNQEPPVFKEMTLRENLLLWSSNPVDDNRLKEVLESLNLQKFTDKLGEKFEHFSGGEKVRLGLARILIKNPKIMLLDEPTSSLDSESALEVRKILLDIHKKYPEKTIICVTHDKELVKENLESGGRSINLGNNSN